MSCGTYNYWMSERKNKNGDDKKENKDKEKEEKGEKEEKEEKEDEKDKVKVAEPDISITPPFEVPPGSPVKDSRDVL